MAGDVAWVAILKGRRPPTCVLLRPGDLGLNICIIFKIHTNSPFMSIILTFVL